MLVRVGLENGFEGRRSIAWALDVPGCIAYGGDGSEALMRLPQALLDFSSWANHHAGQAWLELGDMDIRLVETWEVYQIRRGYDPKNDELEINSWFRSDWFPLDHLEIQRGLEVLQWQRADLLQIVSGLDDARLDQTHEGERWTIRGLLAHVATAEWWYLDRFGLFGPRSSLPKNPFERFAMVRARLIEVLPGLAGTEQVIGRDGEFWSPRKMLRRAIWHERDHLEHIFKLL
jgi:hypothetical protein